MTADRITCFVNMLASMPSKPAQLVSQNSASEKVIYFKKPSANAFICGIVLKYLSVAFSCWQ